MKLKVQYGYTLIEAMIAAALGLLLLTGLAEIFLSIKSTYQLQYALTNIQENGRFAVYFLNYNIRMAGYTCDQNDLTIASDQRVHNYVDSSNVLTDTDAIVIKKCQNKQLIEIAFFVRDTGRKNATGQSIYSLYEKIINSDNSSSPSQEMVADVASMKIDYGITIDSLNINQYISAQQMKPEDWAKVRSIKIALLLNSGDNILDRPQNYWFHNQVLSSQNRLLYKEWSTYITLREPFTNKG